MDRLDIECGKGERLVVDFTVTDDTGAAQDLTGRTAVFVAKAKVDSSTAVIELTSGAANTGGDITVTDAAGLITVTLFGSATRDFPSKPAPVYALWLDPTLDAADVIVIGNLNMIEVAQA